MNLITPTDFQDMREAAGFTRKRVTRLRGGPNHEQHVYMFEAGNIAAPRWDVRTVFTKLRKHALEREKRAQRIEGHELEILA